MTNTLAPAVIDQDAILRHLKLNPNDPNTQALLLVCDRYHLDPLLKHMVLIQGTPYITRDGYLAVAHRSGMFDGIEVLDIGETTTHYTAKVSVYRRDMSHPFTYVGRYKKGGGNKEYGPEMAVKCAEVMALRRAFNVTGVGAADERWDVEMEQADRPALPSYTREPAADSGRRSDGGTQPVRPATAAPLAPGALRTPSELADIATGEIVESSSRRREPPAQAGMVASGPAKQQLIDAGLIRGIGKTEAVRIAIELWGDRGKSSISVGELAGLVDTLGPVELAAEAHFDE